MLIRSRVFLALSVVMLAALALHADEGMWLFTNPPRQQLKEKYGFEVTPQWLEHVQKSSARIGAGGSGSFVSPDGLVMTNHHVASDAIQKVSTREKNYMRDGFHARTRDQEIKCPDQEIDVLMSIEDVTDRVNAAVKPGMDAAAAQKARQGAINEIEEESKKKTGLHSEVVTLYQGGQYHLYRYKRYDDVRLVFAPEQAIAFFGGDPDNFEFPRYDLDVAFFRVYENGKPAKVDHYLSWSKDGVKEGELTFVSGHPGRTERLNTVAHLEFIRDVDMPNRLNVIRRREVALKNYSDRSVENERRARDDLFSMQNSRKARLGMLAGLQDPAVMARKKAAEKALREAVTRIPRSRKSTATPGTRSPSRSRTTRTSTRNTTFSSSAASALASTASSSPSPSGSSAWPRRAASPTPSGCPSTPSPDSTRSSKTCSPTRRSTKTWRSSSSAIRWACWSSSSGRTMKWCRRSWPASRPAPVPPNWSPAPSSAT